LFGNKLEDEEKVPFKACSDILVPFFKDIVHRNGVGPKINSICWSERWCGSRLGMF
jgi:hypothetical protein